ncbi:hypothetical protein ACFV0T_39850 [Streptomyces sp. NPDC059582]|uniref:hypothetical protein n=1 Tax=Streptomyces sp. NPDC059582 TaxID=3346875 RepID=UPI00369AFE75
MASNEITEWPSIHHSRGRDHRQPATERQGALPRAHREWIAAYGEERLVREL